MLLFYTLSVLKYLYPTTARFFYFNMGSSLKDKHLTSAPRHVCEHVNDNGLNGSCVYQHVEPAAASSCWPGFSKDVIDQEVPETQVASAESSEVSNNLHNLDQLLPDTQRNSASLQATFQNVTAVLWQQDEPLPDTQRNVLQYSNN